jgi:hypothetical protein
MSQDDRDSWLKTVLAHVGIEVLLLFVAAAAYGTYALFF